MFGHKWFLKIGELSNSSISGLIQDANEYMISVKIKYRILNIARDLLMSTVFVLLLTFLLVDVVNNYGNNDFPKLLMKFNKEILILSLSLVLLLFAIMVFCVLKLVIRFSKSDSPCEITNQGIYFYYSPFNQKDRSYIEWAKVKEIKLVNRSVSGGKMKVIIIDIGDLDNYIESCTMEQRKYIKNSMNNYNCPISFSIKDFDMSEGKTFQFIIEYWNEWKKNNEYKTS